MVWIGGGSVGALIRGIMSEWVGLRAPVATGAVAVIAVWIWALRVRKRVAEMVEGHVPDR